MGGQTALPDSSSYHVTPHDDKVLSSPLRLILCLVASVFLIEAATMMFIIRLPKISLWVECLLDSALLSICLFPILYRYVFKPMLHLVADYRLSEQNLIAARDRLEEKVAERTEALNQTLLRLVRENAERCQAEFALSESEERFRQIFEQSEDAIALFDYKEDRILDVNPVTEQLFRKTKAELLTGGVRGLCSGNDQDRLAKVLDELRNGATPGELVRFDLQIEGERHVLSFRGKQILLLGSPVLYTTFRDITRRVRLEEESQEIQARLIHANRMTSLGVLVASMAHEINNPNNYILMNAALLQQTWKDIHAVLRERFEQEGEFMIGGTTFSEAAGLLPEVYEGIADGARRIREIVNNLKDYGRDERSGLDGLVDLNAVVRQSVSILNHQIARMTRNFSLDLAESLPLVKGSVRQLEQVVVNLIVNALQALPDKEKGIRVSTSEDPDGEQVVISVEDQGGGIPEEIATRIMEPFFTTRLDRGGTGLGLAICLTIIRDHQGTITFDSEPGAGTVFRVSLNRAEHHDQEAESASQ